MKINLVNFENVLKKATISYSIDNIQLKMGENIECNVKSADNNCMSILNIPNDVLDIRDDVVFNFPDVYQNVIPFIHLFDEEEVEFSMNDNFLVLTNGVQSQRILFCNEVVINFSGAFGPKEDLDWILQFGIDEDFMNFFDKIKRIGSRFGKVYITVDSGKVYIETLDKTNMYSNGVKFHIKDVDIDDISLCFAYKDIVNLMSILEMEKEFLVKLIYKEEHSVGMMYVESNDGSEKYCILSKQEQNKVDI